MNNRLLPKNCVSNAFARYGKRLGTLAFLCAVLLWCNAVKASPWSASSYFDNSSYYDAYSVGNGKIHFKVLIFAEGFYSNCNAGTGGSGSRIWTHIDGESEYPNLIYYQADNSRNKPGSVSGRAKDKGWVKFQLQSGTIVVTNSYNGDNPAYSASNGWIEIDLKRADNGDHLTYFEFDWFVPDEFNGKEFTASVGSVYHYSGDNSDYNESRFGLGTFSGSDGDKQPQLVSPIFYTANDLGVAGYGMLAVPYIAFQDVYQYNTCYNSNNIPCSDPSGMLYVPSTDTVQCGYYITMQTKQTKSSGNAVIKQWLRSNKINIPAYHKLYNLSVKDYDYCNADSSIFFRDQRYKKITWNIHTPQEEDIMSNDMFEIQRAYMSDYSDAQTIATIPIDWHQRDTVRVREYSYIDSAEAAWYNPIEKSGKIYYRVRRASAAMWGWDGHNYVVKGSGGSLVYLHTNDMTINKSNYYRDDDFDNNHLVHINIVLNNRYVGYGTRENPRRNNTAWDDKAILYVLKIMEETGDTIYLRIPNDSIRAAIQHVYANPIYDSFNLAYPRVHITDVANAPCIHYRYSFLYDTTGITLKKMVSNNNPAQPMTMRQIGRAIYSTNAATLSTLQASVEEYADHVIISWQPTDGAVDQYIIERRPAGTHRSFVRIGTTTDNYYNDDFSDTDDERAEWEYRVTMSYTCNGATTEDNRTVVGSRSPWGRITGRVKYEDGTGCYGIVVVATRSTDGATVQTVVTDANGNYTFDSLPYAGGMTYTIMPTSQTAQFSYNNSGQGSANISLNSHRCMVGPIEFDNLSAVRLTGRVLYSQSTIPVRDANLLLNGVTVCSGGMPVRTDVSGRFEITVPRSAPFTLQVVKAGHTFEDDGFIRIGGDSLITLTAPLDGVRVWDATKVRLSGRITGGLRQAALPVGFALSTNNLGDDMRLVLELEGDNTSYIVRLKDDPLKDTLEYTTTHTVYGSDGTTSTTGQTRIHYQQHRIIIEPDPLTGEYCADLFPVRYKVTQASARGYATLFGQHQSSETLDLGAAASSSDTVTLNDAAYSDSPYFSMYAVRNAIYNLTYRSPISISCKQLRYGMEVDYYGEEKISRQNIQDEVINVPLATLQDDGTYSYLFGAPVFDMQDYTFRITAHEDYYYNNDRANRHDEVRINGGTLKVYNGMYDVPVTQIVTKELDSLGQATITIPIDYVSFLRTGESALRVLDLSVESDGDYIEQQVLRAYVMGNRSMGNDYITYTHGKIQLLDILRDPPGTNSSAYLKEGTEYSYSYTYDFAFKFGINFGLSIGTASSLVMGTYAGVGGGVFTGQQLNYSNVFNFSLPITSSYNYKHNGTYKFKTADRIETSSDQYHVGTDGDLYMGLVQNVYFGLTNAVKPIDSLTYATLAARSANGSMSVVAQGRDTNGNKYYLAIGKEIETGTFVNATFVYDNDHIENTIIPKLRRERDALLLTGDSASVQAVANARREPVYWSRVAPTDSNWARANYYVQLLPVGTDRIFADEVSSYNKMIADWVVILVQNEAEKVSAIHHGTSELVGTYSLGTGLTLNHSEEYAYSNAFHIYWDYPGFNVGLGDFIKNAKALFGQSVLDKVKDAYRNIDADRLGDEDSAPWNTAVNSPGSSVSFSLVPVLDFNFGRDPVSSTSTSREIGFNLKGDGYSYMDVSVYRVKQTANHFNTGSRETRTFVGGSGNGYDTNTYLYGSPVYYLRGGASRCPWEGPDSTRYYQPKMPISAGTLKMENQKIDIDVHELSNIPIDHPAVFHLRLSNEMEQEMGAANMDMKFTLKINDGSNPKGAKIFIDGEPLTSGRTIKLRYGQIMNKTMEVYAGDGYDFEDIEVVLVSECNIYNSAKARFSVHYMPVASEVSISAPANNWLLNTLSAKDSLGYYIPVVIDNFNVNYKGFDHIEFQYKLVTQSDDSWVNLCSYYADSALYTAASGTKEMIVNGRIDNIHFYGERDPVEQQYELRAVSFCRHGNGFITRSSDIVRGTKDTRCPRVFGSPEPANSILGVGDNIALRFSEPIAGNYLDEDNNFQVLGVTNATGVTYSTSVFFDDDIGSIAYSQIPRNLNNNSFSIDMIVKPLSELNSSIFSHGEEGSGGLSIGIETENGKTYILALLDTITLRSLPIEPITDFTRIVFVYNNTDHSVHFFAGTHDVTAPNTDTLPTYTGNFPFYLGQRFYGNLMELRVWVKALTLAEIEATNNRRLTGYERNLLAYYPMNEGRGTTLVDRAGGADLVMSQATWSLPNGIAMAFDGSQTLEMAHEVMSRSDIQDYTLMFWFRTAADNAALLSAGYAENKGTLIAIEQGRLAFHNERMTITSQSEYNDGAWHHLVLTVNRTYNNASLYIDGKQTFTFACDTLTGLNGTMLLGGANALLPNLVGHIDDVILFEQALPQSLISTYDNLAPAGNEMGLIAYLPFSEQRENNNGILEQVFSPNNRRIFTTSDGTVINKEQSVLINGSAAEWEAMADRNNHAPIRTYGILSKMNFDWTYNNENLIINLNMLDREINKNSIYITVRNVEDVNGNRLVSPVMWQAFVDRNALRWVEDKIDSEIIFNNEQNHQLTATIRNTSGLRHNYTIEEIPSWLSVDNTYGAIEPTANITLHLTIDPNISIGDYFDYIYVTDENGLSEPLPINVSVKAICPWEDIDIDNLDQSMSLRGKVLVNNTYDNDSRDVVVAMIDGLVVGRSNITYDNASGTNYLYMTIYGKQSLMGHDVVFRLWQASTGRIFLLSESYDIIFADGGIIGVSPNEPVELYTAGDEIQNISLDAGWNWISLNVRPTNHTSLQDILLSPTSFSQGDLIKSPAMLQFSEYNDGKWMGTLSHLSYDDIYMFYAKNDIPSMLVSGYRLLTNEERTISLHNGWNNLPYLLTTTKSVTSAMADYLDKATVGDIIKSHGAFAVFTENHRWEGSLTAMTPGEGYLLLRNSESITDFTYYQLPEAKQAKGDEATPVFHAPYATNMTVIAAVEHPSEDMRVLAYSGSTLAGIATPQIIGSDTLFFITIGGDNAENVSFVIERNGIVEGSTGAIMNYQANTHRGTIRKPVLLQLGRQASVSATPTVFADHVDFRLPDESLTHITIYASTGMPVAEIESSAATIRWNAPTNLPTGIYVAKINHNETTTIIKLIKK